MIDQRIRERMAATKKLMDDPRADPGTAQAARNRYQAMVEKYGDPDDRPPGVNFRYTEFKVSDAAQTWGGNMDMSDLVVAMQRMARTAAYNRQRSAEMDEYLRSLRRKKHDETMRNFRAGMDHAQWFQEQAELAQRWLANFYGLAVRRGQQGIGWDFNDHGRNYRNVTDQQLVDFAMMKGWDGK